MGADQNTQSHYLAERVCVPDLKVQPGGDLGDSLVPGEYTLLLVDYILDR